MRPYNEDEAIDGLTFITQLNDDRGKLTLYAVVCGEHGGHITQTAAKAIEAARAANADASERGMDCVYRPLALTLDPRNLPEFPLFDGTEG